MPVSAICCYSHFFVLHHHQITSLTDEREALHERGGYYTSVSETGHQLLCTPLNTIAYPSLHAIFPTSPSIVAQSSVGECKARNRPGNKDLFTACYTTFDRFSASSQTSTTTSAAPLRIFLQTSPQPIAVKDLDSFDSLLSTTFFFAALMTTVLS